MHTIMMVDGVYTGTDAAIATIHYEIREDLGAHRKTDIAADDPCVQISFIDVKFFGNNEQTVSHYCASNK